jgi:hypothetical protein
MILPAVTSSLVFSMTRSWFSFYTQVKQAKKYSCNFVTAGKIIRQKCSMNPKDDHYYIDKVKSGENY